MAPSSKPNPLPSSFISDISTVAVAQICLSAGYTSADPVALRSLTSVASLYLRNLAASAASVANTKGRTQCNLLDLIRAVEGLAISQSGGFAGASDPTRNLLESSAIKDLRTFVRSVKEVPFPKPIRKDARVSACDSAAAAADSAAARSFAEAGREPPGPHVPRWLPCISEGWRAEEERRRERGEERMRWEEKSGTFGEGFKEIEVRGREKKRKRVLQEEEEEGFWVASFPGCWEMKRREKESGFLMAGRKRVKFELMGENSKRRGEKRMEKRLLLLGDGED